MEADAIRIVLDYRYDKKLSGWMQDLGSCLYVCKDFRVAASRVMSERNIALILRALCATLAGNHYVKYHYARVILDNLREIMNNRHIPYDVNFYQLRNAIPNFIDGSLALSIMRIDHMSIIARAFEDKYGNGDFREICLTIYTEIISSEYYKRVSSEVIEYHDLFMATTTIGYTIYQSAPTRETYIKLHISYLLIWYGLLIESIFDA